MRIRDENRTMVGFTEGTYSSNSEQHTILTPLIGEQHPNANGVNDTRNGCVNDKVGHFFLTPEAAHNLRQFRYQGEDCSLLYKYVLSPLAEFVVQNWIPRTMAPNTITLSGLVIMLASYLITYAYTPTLEPPLAEEAPLPRWIFLYNGIAMLLYQTLDNMDGKQARRTGSSSPLGQLFDHGCDAINSLFGSAGWIIAMAVTPADDLFLVYFTLFTPYIIFYCTTLEEYFTGRMHLPIFNGPNEGVFGGAMLSISSWYFGPDLWQTPLFPSYAPWRLADILVGVGALIYYPEILRIAVRLAQKHGWRATMTVWSPMLIWLLCFVVVAFVNPDIWLRVPRASLHLCAGLFVEMATHLMVAHMTAKRPFQPRYFSLAPLCGLTLAVIMGWLSAGSNSDTLVIIYATAACTWQVINAIVLLHEMCHVLNVKCFDITKRSL